jgi:hypothetical protein
MAFQIAFATLGPPQDDWRRLRARLLTHRMEKAPKPFWRFFEWTKDEALAVLRRVGWRSQHENFCGMVKLHEVGRLSPERELRRSAKFQREFEAANARSPHWPGQDLASTRTANWREDRSLTFPADFFARPESMAAVRTIYDQVTRSILDCLDRAGFDVSDYRDSEGNYVIKAETIEQLVVGEKIYVAEDDRGEGKQEKRAEQRKPVVEVPAKRAAAAGS